MINADFCNAPKNKAEVRTAVNFLLPERNITVDTKEDLLVDLCERKDTGEGLVHLFNVSYIKGKTASAKVSFKWKNEVKTLTRIGYDMAELPLKFKKDGAKISFSLEDIKESAVIVINKIKSNN